MYTTMLIAPHTLYDIIINDTIACLSVIRFDACHVSLTTYAVDKMCEMCAAKVTSHCAHTRNFELIE